MFKYSHPPSFLSDVWYNAGGDSRTGSLLGRHLQEANPGRATERLTSDDDGAPDVRIGCLSNRRLSRLIRCAATAGTAIGSPNRPMVAAGADAAAASSGDQSQATYPPLAHSSAACCTLLRATRLRATTRSSTRSGRSVAVGRGCRSCIQPIKPYPFAGFQSFPRERTSAAGCGARAGQ